MNAQNIQPNPASAAARDGKKAKRRKWLNITWKVLAAGLVLIIASCSMTVDSVVLPSAAKAGDILPITMHVTLVTGTGQTSNFMVAVLVPKAWKVAQNATISFTSEATTGDQAMTVIPAGQAAPQGGGLDWPTLLATKIGNGGNLLPDYEWVAFYSNQAYTIGDNTTVGADVHMNIKTSLDNIAFKFGFCAANSSDGLSSTDRYGFKFTNCYHVEGDGDLIDFCNPQLATVDPRTSEDNDIVTLTFDGGVQHTDLDNASQVYLCVSGLTDAGDSLSVCAPTDQLKMRSLGLNKWQKDIWPRKLFNLSNQQHLTALRYWFIDAAGHKVGYAATLDPFPYTFKCQ